MPRVDPRTIPALPPDAGRPEILYVEWVDSAGTPGWCSKEEIDHSKNIMPIRSVGFLVHDTKDALVLALNHSHGERIGRPFGELMTIPKIAITKRTRIL